MHPSNSKPTIIHPVPNKTTSTLLVFFLILSFYLYSLLPSLAWGDGVKLQSEAVSGESFVISEMPADEFKPDQIGRAHV